MVNPSNATRSRLPHSIDDQSHKAESSQITNRSSTTILVSGSEKCHSAAEKGVKSVEKILSGYPRASPRVVQVSQKKLTASGQRLKIIEEALSGLPRYAPPPEIVSTGISLAERCSGLVADGDDQLPSEWLDSFSTMSLASSSSISRTPATRDNYSVAPLPVTSPNSSDKTKGEPIRLASQGSALHPTRINDQSKQTSRTPSNWPEILSQLSLGSAVPRSRTSTMLKEMTTGKSAPYVAPVAHIHARKETTPTSFLSHEQSQILKLVQSGESVFYTGSAGTGKSVLLREIIKTLRTQYVETPDSIAITASTGIAACNIGGVTLHSFAGIGLGLESAEELVAKIKKNKKAKGRWMRTQVLIIDEVSMVDGDLFDKLAKIASALRNCYKPFGGIQVIVTGDFFQLPPVSKGDSQVKFAFEAEQWKATVQYTYNLTKVFRQKDQSFVDMLNELRFGNLSLDSIKAFKRLSRAIVYDDGIAPTELFPRREDVERSNTFRISQLRTQEESYTAIDGGFVTDRNQREKMLSNFMAPRRLTLRVDAQVMLIKNVDETLVNGSMGRVLSFVDPAVYGVPDPESPPLTAAGAFGPIEQRERYPVIEFIVPHGGRRRMLVTPEVWKVELPNGEVQVSRRQLPLMLSWAMSIHKSQGQTLDRVKVDLGKVFEKGQAYVALSRATSLEGLEVLNFDASKVKAHPKVITWSETLSTIGDHGSFSKTS